MMFTHTVGLSLLPLTANSGSVRYKLVSWRQSMLLSNSELVWNVQCIAASLPFLKSPHKISLKPNSLNQERKTNILIRAVPVICCYNKLLSICNVEQNKTKSTEEMVANAK